MIFAPSFHDISRSFYEWVLQGHAFYNRSTISRLQEARVGPTGFGATFVALFTFDLPVERISFSLLSLIALN